MKSPSELILNAKGHIYHLDLPKDALAPICITVGDPERVAQVSKYFDSVSYRQSHREFVTHVGLLHGKKIMVISTGIGTDNIDIVLNELDALANIDLKSGIPYENHTSLQFIRIGTSGTFSPTIPVDGILINKFGFGLDGLMRFYPKNIKYPDQVWLSSLSEEIRYLFKDPYLGTADSLLYDTFKPYGYEGIAITCPGFYGPQGRILRLESLYNPSLFQSLSDLIYQGVRFTNFEMETAGIYALATALGHQAVSINIILANRALGVFSQDANLAVDNGIKTVLEKISVGL